MSSLLTVGCALTLLAGSCAKSTDIHEKLVLKAIKNTQRLSRSFVYTETSTAGQVTVQGIIEDDYRYKAQLSADESPVLERVGRDDALAVRLLNPELAAELLARAAQEPASAASSAISDISVLEPLRARRWVVDKFGAPDLRTSRAGERRQVGNDPILDGLTALTFVERAIAQAGEVVRFSEESSQYSKEEDNFPVPDDDSGVTRYDLLPPELPRPNRSGGSAGGLPQTSHFRRMSVYLKNNRVVEVYEAIGVLRRQFDHLAEFYEIDIPEGNLGRASATAIAELNKFSQGAGGEPIRLRIMSLENVDFEVKTKIELPSDAMEGSLVGFGARAARASTSETNS